MNRFAEGDRVRIDIPNERLFERVRECLLPMSKDLGTIDRDLLDEAGACIFELRARGIDVEPVWDGEELHLNREDSYETTAEVGTTRSD